MSLYELSTRLRLERLGTPLDVVVRTTAALLTANSSRGGWPT